MKLERNGETRELERVVPREVVMGSSLMAEVRRAGRAEGEIAAARSLCADLAKQHHAASLPQVAAAIRACRDAGVLARPSRWAKLPRRR